MTRRELLAMVPAAATVRPAVRRKLPSSGSTRITISTVALPCEPPRMAHVWESEAPSKDTILAARDRLVARYPKLRVIGCHLGSNEEDLGDREKTGRFVLKYQDRLLYATDFTLGAGDDERAAAPCQRLTAANGIFRYRRVASIARSSGPRTGAV